MIIIRDEKQKKNSYSFERNFYYFNSEEIFTMVDCEREIRKFSFCDSEKAELVVACRNLYRKTDHH